MCEGDIVLPICIETSCSVSHAIEYVPMICKGSANDGMGISLKEVRESIEFTIHRFNCELQRKGTAILEDRW